MKEVIKRLEKYVRVEYLVHQHHVCLETVADLNDLIEAFKAQREVDEEIVRRLGLLTESPSTNRPYLDGKIISVRCGFLLKITALLTDTQPPESIISEPEPCKFCGSESSRYSSHFGLSHAIVCNQCGANGPIAYSKEKAVEQWNRCSSSDAEKLERVRVAVRGVKDLGFLNAQARSKFIDKIFSIVKED